MIFKNHKRQPLFGRIWGNAFLGGLNAFAVAFSIKVKRRHICKKISNLPTGWFILKTISKGTGQTSPATLCENVWGCVFPAILVKKANERVVSSRQKHNGMAWSREGSICITQLNGEMNDWLFNRSIHFDFDTLKAA